MRKAAVMAILLCACAVLAAEKPQPVLITDDASINRIEHYAYGWGHVVAKGWCPPGIWCEYDVIVRQKMKAYTRVRIFAVPRSYFDKDGGDAVVYFAEPLKKPFLGKVVRVLKTPLRLQM